jgi:transcriptional regulator with XRE-family HTH domain
MAAGKDLTSVAKEIGVSQQTLRQAGDANRSRNPSTERLIAVAEATGAPVEWIVSGWDAVVTRAEAGAAAGSADDDALLARISETIDGIADEVRHLGKQQAKTDDRLRALERRGSA